MQIETAPEEKKTRKKAAPAEMSAHVDAREEVAVRAYFLAQQAGFDECRELDFWLQAESELMASPNDAPTPEKPKRVRKPRLKTPE